MNSSTNFAVLNVTILQEEHCILSKQRLTAKPSQQSLRCRRPSSEICKYKKIQCKKMNLATVHELLPTICANSVVNPRWLSMN